MRVFLIVFAAAAISGCVTKVIGNEAGGMIDVGTGLVSTAFAKANTHCQQFGKVARVSSTSLLGDMINFDCVAP